MTRRTTFQLFAIISLVATMGYALDDSVTVSGDDGTAETGSTETGSTETGSTETGSTETGSTETGSTETGSTETGDTETGDTEPDGVEADNNETESPTTQIADQKGAKPNELDGTDNGGVRLREGMKFVNRVGELRDAGGRVAFYPDGQTQSLPLLENLALERVSHDLDQTHRKWSVTGIVTEYKGGNYLLLHRAVLKARVSTSSGPRS